MSSAAQTKKERINLRLEQQAKQVLERAASFEGQTVSKIILSSAMSSAEKIIEEHEFMALKVSDSEAFFNALNKPVQFNRRLADALKEHDQRVSSK